MNKRWILALTQACIVALVFVAPHRVGAAEDVPGCDHHCDSYELALLHIGLATEASEIGIAALHADNGHSFYRSADELAALRQKAADDMKIPSECMKKLKNQSWFQVTARAAFDEASRTQVTLDVKTANSITQVYGTMLSNFSKTCPATGATPAWCNPKNSKITNFGIYMQQSPQAALSALKGVKAFSNLNPTVNLVTLAQTYDQWIRTTNDAQSTALFNSLKGISNDAKFNLAAMMLAQLNVAYDSARSKGSGPNASGVVSYSEMRQALLTNAAAGLLYSTSVPLAVAGICRDHHSMAAQALRDMGVPNSYTMSWAESDTEHHVIVLAQAPGENLRVRTDNYGVQGMTIGRDGYMALYRGTNDDSAIYRIAVPSGSIVGAVASGTAVTLAEVAGFDPKRTFDPLLTPKGMLLAPNISADPDGHLQARAFVATDGNGAQYFGAAGTVSYGATDRLPTEAAQTGKVGFAVGTRIAPVDAASLASGYIDSTSQFVYGQAEHNIRTAGVPLGGSKATQLRLEGSVSAVMMGVYTDSHNSDNGSFNMDGDLRVSAGARISHNMNGAKDKKNPTDPVSWQLYAGVQASPIGLYNIQNNDTLQFVVPYLNNVVLAAETSKRLAGDSKAPRLFAAGTLVYNYFGTRAKGEIGIANDKLSATVGVHGRLLDASPIFDEGSIREVDGNLVFKPLPQLRLGVNAYHVLDRDSAMPPIFGLGGNITLTE